MSNTGMSTLSDASSGDTVTYAVHQKCVPFFFMFGLRGTVFIVMWAPCRSSNQTACVISVMELRQVQHITNMGTKSVQI